MEPHHFHVAPVPSKIFDAAPAPAIASTLSLQLASIFPNEVLNRLGVKHNGKANYFLYEFEEESL
jgi:hypothetical protein